MKKRIGWALAGLALAGAAWAAELPEAVFIVDASGSMEAAAGDLTKMEAAKGVLAHVVEGLPGEVKTGLAAYGHTGARGIARILKSWWRRAAGTARRCWRRWRPCSPKA